MPSYDYKCDKCEVVFEETHKVDDREKPTKKKCKCGGKIYIDIPSTRTMYRAAEGKMSPQMKEVFDRMRKSHPHGKFPS